MKSAGLMTNRVALVTGATCAIGVATAKLLAHHGAAVGVNYYNNQAVAQSVVEAIEAEGGKAIAVQGNVEEESEVAVIVEQVTAAFGLIDTLVLNAAGKFLLAPFVDYQWSDFEEKLLGKLKSVFYPCKAVIPDMLERKHGCIIVLSTSLSHYPNEGFIAHSTAKSGVDAFVKSLALELRPQGIRVNTIAPGLSETDATAYFSKNYKYTDAQMIPHRHKGQPEDVAGAVLLLASNEAKYITGAYLPVSGGIQMI